MAEFFMEFTEMWLVGVGDIVIRISDFFFMGSNGIIGNVLLGVLVFNLFFIYIIRPATYANSDTVLTKGIAHYSKKDPVYDSDLIMGQLELQRLENIHAQERWN